MAIQFNDDEEETPLFNMDEKTGGNQERAPWDDPDLTFVADDTMHTEAPTSINARVALPILSGKDVGSFWTGQMTIRSGATMQAIEALLNAAVYAEGIVASHGGYMLDQTTGEALTVQGGGSSATASGSGGFSSSNWTGPIGTQWDDDMGAPYMMAEEVSLTHTRDGDPVVRVRDNAFFSQYGLPLYPDDDNPPSPVEYYGLEDIISRGRPNKWVALKPPVKVYFLYKTDADGDIKPIKGIIPWSEMTDDQREAIKSFKKSKRK